MTRQLILGYGRDTEPQRIIFSALSFWAWYEGDRANAQTIIFTDRPEVFASYFVGLPVVCRQLTPESLARMRGPQNFVHRIKLAIIEEVALEYPEDNILYCDSDTFFTTAVAPLLDSLQPGSSVMHVREYSLAEAADIWASYTPANQDLLCRKFIEVIENQTFTFMGKVHNFHRTQYMWNAGLIGMPKQSTAQISEFIALTDAFYAASGWVMSEQMAFSLGLQASTELLPGNHYVYHYWGQRQKVVMDGLLADIDTQVPSNKSLNERLARVRMLTNTWQQTVNADEARQTALLAFSNGEVLSGVKQVAKVLAANSFDTEFAKESFKALWKKSKT